MSRAALLALGGLALLAAGWLQPEPAGGAAGLTALGRSLGGWRVAAVDVLYLRAEALRGKGLVEELPAIYRTIVELDPGNEAATDLLAGTLAAQAAAAARDDEQRFTWWQEAWGMTRQALETHTTSATLAFRAGDLLLDAVAGDPALTRAVEALFGGASRREAAGLGYLLAAARLEEHLPRTGRSHLVRLARRAPLLAAAALARGQSDAEVLARLAAAEELLTLHPAAMAEVEVAGAPTPEAPEGRRVLLAARVTSAGRLLRAALAWRAGGAQDAFERGLAEFAPLESRGEESLAAALSAWAAHR